MPAQLPVGRSGLRKASLLRRGARVVPEMCGSVCWVVYQSPVLDAQAALRSRATPTWRWRPASGSAPRAHSPTATCAPRAATRATRRARAAPSGDWGPRTRGGACGRARRCASGRGAARPRARPEGSPTCDPRSEGPECAGWLLGGGPRHTPGPCRQQVGRTSCSHVAMYHRRRCVASGLACHCMQRGCAGANGDLPEGERGTAKRGSEVLTGDRVRAGSAHAHTGPVRPAGH